MSGVKQHGSIRIRAFIDGSDTIKIRDSELWYQHHNYDLPGKWQDRFDEPTYINDKAWNPQWDGSISKPFQDLHPSLPKRATDKIKLTKIQGRGNVSIVVMPNKENDYTLSIYFDDDRYNGAEWYEIMIEW
jgi:hypothetical protein